MFCECGGLITNEDGRLVCSDCEKICDGEVSLSSKQNSERRILTESKSTNPTTDNKCPKCEHPESEYWIKQTRSSDEPPTRFYRCVKCKHTWREYS